MLSLAFPSEDLRETVKRVDDSLLHLGSNGDSRGGPLLAHKIRKIYPFRDRIEIRAESLRARLSMRFIVDLGDALHLIRHNRISVGTVGGSLLRHGPHVNSSECW